MNEHEKHCSKCDTVKSRSEFNKRRGANDGLYAWCAECAKPVYSQWYKKNKADADERRRRNRYGLTFQDLDALIVDFEKNGCPGCRKPHTVKRGVVDHCHTTLEVRGALCGACNKVLGFVCDSPETLRNLAAYLENPPARRLLAP